MTLVEARAYGKLFAESARVYHVDMARQGRATEIRVYWTDSDGPKARTLIDTYDVVQLLVDIFGIGQEEGGYQNG